MFAQYWKVKKPKSLQSVKLMKYLNGADLRICATGLLVHLDDWLILKKEKEQKVRKKEDGVVLSVLWTTHNLVQNTPKS